MHCPKCDAQILLSAEPAILAADYARVVRELEESHQQQVATGEILGIISRSPSDVQPVLDAVAESAARLCEAIDASIWRADGDRLRLVAHHGQIPHVPVSEFTIPLVRGTVNGRAALDQRTVHVADLLAEAEEFPEGSEYARQESYRTSLSVPLMREGVAIGTINLRRADVQLFTERQVALLQTFAKQAVIAIENARLFEAEQTRSRELQTRSAELAESLEYQTAISEVLNVISRSPNELQPVLDTIVLTARRLCGAERSMLTMLRDGKYRLVAHDGNPPDVVEYLTENPLLPDRSSATGRVALERKTVQIPNALVDPEFGQARQSIDKTGTVLGVPLLRKGEVIGAIAMWHTEVKPFTDKQIELVTTFADQAVIAINNVGLFEEVQARTRELQESLEYQTAISEVLKVIGRSPNELQPVLDVIVETAGRLCQAEDSVVFRLKDGKYHLVAGNDSSEVLEYLTQNPIEPGQRGSVTARAVLERRTIHVPDAMADPDYGQTPLIVGTVLSVPLLRDSVPVGALTLSRKITEHFTDKQIELVTTFADQAVIAVNNVGLFEEVQARTKELTESLKQQTATAEVLKVISRSTFDLQTVLDTLTESAARLCGADMAGFTRHEGLGYREVTNYGYPPDWVEFNKTMRYEPGRASVVGRVLMGAKVIQVADVLADPEYTLLEAQKKGGFRTALGIPMLREGKPIGVFFLGRSTVSPFNDKQIELLETFADQAVIAIENARLFEEVQARTAEVQETLEYQTATSEVLNVISRSPSQLQPVLDAILQTSARLCEAEYAVFWRLGPDDKYHLAGCNNVEAAYVKYLSEHPISLDRGSLVGRAALESCAIHLPDCLADPEYALFEYQSVGKFRTMLGVPLVREDVAIGVITLHCTVVKPFTDKQIELVTTFADQALIAIENTRLFEEVQARTRELTESLEYQTATSEVLNVISRSPNELQPVLDEIARTACRTCDAYDTVILMKKGEDLRVVAHHGSIPADFEKAPISRDWVSGRAVVDREPIQVPDLRTAGDEFPFGQAFALRLGHRTCLAVPLMRDGEAIGCLLLRRMQIQPFTEKQIALLQTFADQAVIAINNTRLFEEVQARTRELQARSAELTEALEQQTAMSEVLRVISGSPTELQPVLDALVKSVSRLCGVDDVSIFRLEGDGLPVAAHYGPIHQPIGFVTPVVRGTVSGRCVLERRPVQLADLQSETVAFPEGSAIAREFGHRTIVAVPLLREGLPLGAIVLRRTRVEPFTHKQIELVTTFADQAVIAIENTRLFEEVQSRTRELARSVAELKALSEISQAVNASLDLETVLSTILAHACQMSDSGGGAIYVFDETKDEYVLEAGHHMSDELIAAVRAQRLRRGTPVVGECVEKCATVQVPDLELAGSYSLFDVLRRGGIKALLAVPLLHRDKAIGALLMRRMSTGPFAPETVLLLQNFATQSSLAIYNARLFREIEQKSRELEIASQHKSQFVASMSHELRTPLAAMLGYAELLKEGIYGALPSKSTPIVTRIQSNGKHLLGLINTVLDISKIEAGQFKLNLAEYALGSVIETVRVATESLAAAKKLALETNITKDLPCGLGDEQRLTQVLLNLVGNAIKFTDAGEVRITAAAANGHYALCVSDTGPGIPLEEREQIFEKFHQIDSSITKAKGGTGLGLAIAKQIVEMHGGRIWVESTLGQGSTFRMELPVRAAGAA
jgi:GAF domain-containing protein/anti-sigma regulatory factor (Ser/Thr protein kinase)